MVQQESSSLQPPLPHPLPSDDDGANSDDDPATLLSPLPIPDPLQHASVLTQEQLLHRRASRLRHLLRIYRAQYWGLLEEMRSKYRRFYLRHGKSGWRRDPGPANPTRDDPTDLPAAEMKQPHAPEPDVAHCGAQGCVAKPLLLSSYCYMHILQEPRQRLYKPCSFIIRRGSGKTANVVCQKPVLQAVSPPLCPTHFQQSQKQSVRSLRKAGIVLPVGAFSKSSPKLHHFVAEYVRVILSKRRALRIAQGRGCEVQASHCVCRGVHQQPWSRSRNKWPWSGTLLSDESFGMLLPFALKTLGTWIAIWRRNETETHAGLEYKR